MINPALNMLGFMNAGDNDQGPVVDSTPDIDVSTQYDDSVPFPQYNKYQEYRAQVLSEKKLWDPVGWFMDQALVVRIIIAIAIILLVLFIISIILKVVMGVALPWTNFL